MTEKAHGVLRVICWGHCPRTGRKRFGVLSDPEASNEDATRTLFLEGEYQRVTLDENIERLLQQEQGGVSFILGVEFLDGHAPQNYGHAPTYAFAQIDLSALVFAREEQEVPWLTFYHLPEIPGYVLNAHQSADKANDAMMAGMFVIQRWLDLQQKK